MYAFTYQISQDKDDLLKGFIEVVDNVSKQMFDKVDQIVARISMRFQEFNQSVDGVTTRVSDKLRQVGVETNYQSNNAMGMDYLSRDIELFRVKREMTIKSEAILTQVREDVRRERLREKFENLNRILNGKDVIYQEKAAEPVYRKLIVELGALIKSKPGFINLEVIQDPLGQSHNNISMSNRPESNPSIFSPNLDTSMNHLQYNTQMNPPMSLNNTNVSISSPAQSSIIQQNMSIVDNCNLTKPELTWQKTIATSHKGDILTVMCLNSRFIATTAIDKTLCIWDMSAGMSLMFASQPMDAEILMLKKILVAPQTLIGHVLIAVKNTRSAANVGAFDFSAVDSPNTPGKLLWSNSVPDNVTAMDILSKDKILVGYQGGVLCALDVSTLEIVYRADVKTRIDCLLVLPDGKTVVVVTDNEYTILNFPQSLDVTTRVKRKDTATFSHLRCVGRNSEVFAAFLKNGLVKLYRGSDGEVLNVILGQRAEYESSFILNFFSADPNIFVFALSKFSPYFFYSNIDDTMMTALTCNKTEYSVTKGDPKMQIIDLVPGSHMTFVTVANDADKHPGLHVWKLTFR